MRTSKLIISKTEEMMCCNVSRKHEVYLVSLALILIASIILYNVFNTPELNPAVINTTAGVSTVKNNSNTGNATNTTTAMGSSNSNNASTSVKKNSDVVNLNTATVEELMTLEGIGEVRAQSIISYRNENGNFTTIEELKNVSGIGDRTFDKIKNNITV